MAAFRFSLFSLFSLSGERERRADSAHRTLNRSFDCADKTPDCTSFAHGGTIKTWFKLQVRESANLTQIEKNLEAVTSCSPVTSRESTDVVGFFCELDFIHL